ncbi:hypothetical protein FOG50_03085 [Hanseniaspora uvarum]|uniref:Transcription initiation factor TFIID subunit 9 n=1 Tax=Hanseniaspora uvarum TaxID=29833 RepID=A0A1E5RQK2_HANUV|nr:hypothetical protein FOG48_02541 [Hanseniaspora uvarum]KAF0276074.1 hypothetical protein FOG50_03085 [Hanseniaspora uvarum]OEJ89187.1 Transcription initiation factor TFIID subunit 9 [Hanseniaspora uvarum]GMM42764.1 chromatin modification protein [Hanseniaspora uvarum]
MNSSDSKNVINGTKNTPANEQLLKNNIPRDLKTLHLLLGAHGIDEYEDTVLLQLLDFSYRYTKEILEEALEYNEFAVVNQPKPLPAPIHTRSNVNGEPSTIDINHTENIEELRKKVLNGSRMTVDDLRLAINTKTQFQFKQVSQPKELMLQLSQERNKKPLPKLPTQYGMRLPPEKYCLSSVENVNNDEAEDSQNPAKKMKQ